IRGRRAPEWTDSAARGLDRSVDLAKPAALDLVHETVDRNVLDPGMGPDRFELGSKVLLQIGEWQQRQVNLRAGPGRQVLADRLVLEREHAAIGVLDHDDL